MSVSGFLFLRPWWLLALLILPLWFWWQRRQVHGARSWRHAVDPHLLPHLLAHGSGKQQRWRSVLPLLAAILGICALAGPSWRQTAVPLWQTQSPLVVALDLSSAMRTADLPPNRLTQAKARLQALFQERRGGQLGLLVYAGDAFSVAPITRDASTLDALLDSLQPDIMPVDGQRADRAIAHAQDMLQAAGFVRGDILLVSDFADAAAKKAARDARNAGFAVSALGVGTAAGAPLANAQGFVSGADGKLKLARLDATSLRELATAGGGRYATLSADGADLRELDLLEAHGALSQAASGAGTNDSSVSRSDDGYWLLLPMLAVVLLLFRRGVVLLLLCSLSGGALLHSTPALADAQSSPAATSSGWSSWWQRADQRARAALDAGDVQAARELAQDPALQAAAAYRSEDFEAAAKAWSGLPQADAAAHYNRGNALARAGKYAQALAAYDQALAQQPQMADAIANRAVVEDALKQQQKQQQGQSGEDSQPQDQQDKSQQDSAQSQSDQSEDSQQSQSESQSQDDASESGSESGESNGERSESESDDRDAKSGDQSQEQEQQQAQAQAREALREQMQEELEQQAAAAAAAGEPADDQPAEPARVLSAEERAELEKSQAMQQWLRRVPDDPGALLRRKFAREHQLRQQQGDSQ